MVRKFRFPSDGITVIVHFKTDPNILLFGTKKGAVGVFDTRTPFISITPRRQGAISSLQISPDGSLFASGGNNDEIHVYDIRNLEDPILNFAEHKAAVTALCWINNQCLLSGGGRDDETIKAWDINNGTCNSSINTTAQVCTLQLTKCGELISTHGYGGKGINLWKLRTSGIYHIKKFEDQHKKRVLFSVMNPDRTTLITGSPDKTLCIWEGFSPKNKTKSPSVLSSKHSRNQIR